MTENYYSIYITKYSINTISNSSPALNPLLFTLQNILLIHKIALKLYETDMNLHYKIFY